MTSRGFIKSVHTGDIFAIRISEEGKIVGGFGPIKEEEARPWEIDRPFAYSKSIGALIQRNLEEFVLLTLKENGRSPGP